VILDQQVTRHLHSSLSQPSA